MLENRGFTYDGNLVSCAATTKTSTYAGTGIIDTGGGFTKGECVVNVTACTAGTGQLYRLCVQGSPDATFGTAANIVDLAEIRLGAGEVLAAGTSAKDQTTGIYKIPFHNQLGDTVYRYLRFRMVLSGQSPSITCSAIFAADLD